MWNQQRLEQMIADGVEESFTLDYKAAGAFAKDIQKKKEDIQKDVSAFANSAGGTIIYGIREHSSHDKKHLPERIDPIARDQYSKEWLEHIISGIQPRVQGVVIHPVKLDSSTNDCCYVVEIPQSETIHQAIDGRYYRRYNFENRALQDYEIREAMNRAKDPTIDVFVKLELDGRHDEGRFSVKLINKGKRLAKRYLCEVCLPLHAGYNDVEPADPYTIETVNGLSFSSFSLPTSINPPPLFPGAERIHHRKIERGGSWIDKWGEVLTTAKDIKIKVYADEMDAISRTVSTAKALKGWA